MRVLGVSASLRNMRHGAGSDVLAEELMKIETREHLTEYLNKQAQLCVSAFVEAGRKEQRTFNHIYRNLKKLGGIYGLCNSELLLAAGMWGAKSAGAQIDVVSLSDHFEKSEARKTNVLLEKVRAADGILLSGPVYFGDRSSLAHDFLQLLRRNPNIVKDKLFGGLTVGAKRNGGQETCLIYQMIDFINIGLLAVGNDADTTAQYGGTGHAGDVGSGANDEYGIRTSIGTGKRIAHAISLKDYSNNFKLNDKPKIGIFILQDVEEQAKRFVENEILSSDLTDKADFRFFYFVNESVRRCIACDVCPITFDHDQVYRCIIRDKEDLFFRHHKRIIDLDAILLGGYSPISFNRIKSVYQSFMERTRYLRRSDYVFSNCLVSPFVFQEVGSQENLQIRILTSLIRHHTIMHSPVLFPISDGEFIHFNDSWESLNNFVETAIKLTAGRILYHCNSESYSTYMPFGYTLSSERDREQKNIERRQKVLEKRRERFMQMLKSRVQV